jgi:hypothetical protein
VWAIDSPIGRTAFVRFEGSFTQSGATAILVSERSANPAKLTGPLAKKPHLSPEDRLVFTSLQAKPRKIEVRTKNAEKASQTS